MGLNEQKITRFKQPVSSLADRPQMTAALLKAAFDSNTEELKTALNGLIDALRASAAAGEIGAETITGVSGTTVQGLLRGLKAILDTMQTTAGADEKLAGKADKTTVAGMVQSIEFDSKTGVFTITEQGGTVRQIDTAIEKVPLNCRLDGSDFVLSLVDGSEQRVSLANFIHENEFDDTASIQFSVADGHVSAQIKSGGVDDSMLDSALKAQITADRDAAAQSAQNASAYAENAYSNARAAEYAKTAAEDARSTSFDYAENARRNMEESERQAVRAESWADRAEGAAGTAVLCAQTSEAAKQAAETARQGAESAMRGAEAALSAAQELTGQAAASAEAAGQAAVAAETARSGAESAQSGAVAAQAAAEAARQGAETAQAVAETARDCAEAAADHAAKSTAIAQESAESAEQSAQSALESKTASEENRMASDASAASAAESEKNAIAAAEAARASSYILDRDGKRYCTSWCVTIDGFPKLTFQEITA